MRRLLPPLLLAACVPTGTPSAPPEPVGPTFFDVTYPDIPPGTAALPPEPVNTPNPPLDRIIRTELALFHKGLHRNRTYYCVHPSGALEVITTVLPTGDPKLDEIVRETVATWTFKPATAAGKPTRACGKSEFNFRFE